jgi:hypothetical protein
MNRRLAIQSGLLAGLGSGLPVSESDAAAVEQEGDSAVVAAALRDIERTLQRQAENRDAHWQVVRRVHEQQRTFLKSYHRYPEFIEAGARVWDGLIEWHVRERQTLNVTRAADGRYLMSFNFTTVLLRPDLDDNYVSTAYDNDRSR